MDEHFGSKAKGPIGQVQMWTALLFAYLQSFKSLAKSESPWKKTLN
jgi:hypothetical protein